jgi:serine protease Do
VVDQIRNFGHARRGWLGVRIQQVTPDIAESLGLKDASGAMVAGVNDGGPADKAQIHNGDIILSFNGQGVKEMRNLPLIVAQTEIGKSVPLVVWRDGKQVTLQAVVGELPDEQKVATSTTAPDKPAAPTRGLELSGLGLRLVPITPEARDKYQISADQKGVLITDVAGGTPASDRGLKPGDVIVEVQQQPVNSPAEVRDRIEQVRKSNRKSVLILVQSGDGLHWIPLPLTPDPDRKPG